MNSKVKNIIIYSSITLFSGVLAYFLLKKVVKIDNVFLPKKVDNILFVGDSITAEFYKGKRVTWVYSSLIKDQLTDKTIDILAEGGKRTEWMLENLPTQLKKRKYDRVYIWGGVNDMFSATTIPQAIANVQAMVDLVVKQGGKAYVIVGYDTKSFMPDSLLKTTDYVPTKEGMIALKNRYLEYQKELPKKIKNAVIVSAFNLSSSMNADGIHPTPQAHKIIAEEILKNIR